MGAILAMDRGRIMRPPVVAFDRASVRTVDRDGRLHVALSNISKATVDPYFGNEIPGYVELGLSPSKIYKLLRDPGELQKAAATFNNLPILSKHIPVTANAPQKGFVIGSTGTDADFKSPFLQNSAVIWDATEIKQINAKTKKDWSCGYYYTPDMTPGNFNGLPYDGVMRDIVGNHVALVDQGRAGPDVMVGDAMPRGLKMLKSRRALMLNGALAAAIAPRLAQDAKLDLSALLGTVTAAGRGNDTEELSGKVFEAAKPLIAADKALTVEEISAAIMAADMAADDGDMADDDSVIDADTDDDDNDDEDDDEKAKKAKAKKDGQSAKGAPPKAAKIAKPAMDALRAEILAESRAIRDAEKAVAPIIGDVKVACDSASDVYKLALDHAKVDLAGVDPSAFKAMVSLLPRADKGQPIALDHSTVEKSFSERFGVSHLLAS